MLSALYAIAVPSVCLSVRRVYHRTRKPCCRRETARYRCKFWSISTASWAKAEWMRNWKYHL